MKVSAHAKSQVFALFDQLTGLGVKLGGLVCGLSFVYLVAIVVGGHLKIPLKPGTLERVYLEQSVVFATRALVISGAVLVASLVLRFPGEEALGQILCFAGAALYFGGPPALGWFLQGKVVNGSALGLGIVNAVRNVGGIALIPGVVFVVRDAILRVLAGPMLRRSRAKPVAEPSTAAKPRAKLLAACWDMEFCREYVRRVCPAFAKKKSCWRIKIGCFCDERTILKAITADSKDNRHARGIMESLGVGSSTSQDSLSMKVKRQRCRKCSIYAEHQHQKYRLLSPMVFPAVLALIWIYYDFLSAAIGRVLTNADRFLSFLTYHPKGEEASVGSDIAVLTILAIIWLTIIAISYSLKALEYLIFDLQV